MKLLSFAVENFRNLAPLELIFDAPAAAFVGANAQGKTNILEAISLLAFGKSLRTSNEMGLIRHEENFLRVSGTAETKTKTKIRLEVANTREAKVLKINGAKKSAGEFVGNLPIVQFLPEDLNFVLLTPAFRRRRLDALLSQTSREYIRASSAYHKALKNRNALLARIAEGAGGEDELEFWDTELATHGSRIGHARADFADFAALPLRENFNRIAGRDQKLTGQFTGLQREDLTLERYRAQLDKLRAQDLRYQKTNYGPHRQDFIFTLDSEPLAENGSRGEIRSSILALKFTELAFLEKHSGEKPLLLLDDVFSELDAQRQKSLMGLLTGHHTFLTTTKPAHLELLTTAVQIWEVADGKVELLTKK